MFSSRARRRWVGGRLVRALRPLVEAVESRVLLDGTAAFAGAYYNDADLSSPVQTRSDSAIDFAWGAGSPAEGVDPDTFSVRWTGYIKPAYTEQHTFFATADDGVRLSVGSVSVIDRWGDRGGLGGDANGDGVVDFIDFQIFEVNFGGNGPQCDFNADAKVDTADFLILAANFGKSLSTSTGTDVGVVTLEAGKTYPITLDYYENSSDAAVKLEWASPSQVRELVPPALADAGSVIGEPSGGGVPGGGGPIFIGDGNGLLGTYYDGPDFGGPGVSRIDMGVDFEWNGYRPHPRVDATTFSVRWEGQLLAPVTGDYTFYTQTDDGARLWVQEAPFTVKADGTLADLPVMDYWGDQDGTSEYPSDPLHLEAGKRYNIRFEYFQSEGNALAHLRWGGPVAYGNIAASQLFPATWPSGPTSPAPTPLPVQGAGGLMVSPADPHYVVSTDGSPFFWLADTAWALFNKTTRADVDEYLQDRADKEFTVTQAVLYNPDAYSSNAFRQPVFLNNNPATPNAAYFGHVDYVLQRAESLGMYVAVLPTWGDAVAATDSRRVFNSANAFTYGQWLGTRYADQRNIVWVLGGDWASDSQSADVWRSMAAGLRAGDGGAHLITYHPPGGRSSTDYFGQGEPWIAYNTVQSGHRRDSANYDLIAGDYSASPAKPVIDSEPNYENIPEGLQMGNAPLDDYDVRKKTYWSLFAGAFGAAYGNLEVYQFYSGSAPGLRHWREAMDYPGAGQMKYARRLMQSRPYLGRVPDQGLIVGSALGGSDHVRATRAGDGSYAFVYSAGGNDVTVDLSRLSGSTAKAWWYDPRDGSAKAVGEFSTAGAQTFSPPSSGYGQDWVLVLDDVSKGYGAPGTVAPPTPPDPIGDPRLAGSVTGSVSNGSKSIPYRLYKPTGVAAGQKVPLVLYMHGKGERGTDNVLQTTWMGGLVNATRGGTYAAYVLAPQIDPGMWFQSSGSSPTEAMALTIQALKQVIATEAVDTSRVYVTGVSMGGHGTWDVLRWEPNLFAAAVPLSGAADPRTAGAIKHVPIWAFHGANDTIVPVSGSRQMIGALRAAGANPKYTELAGGGHVIWNPIYADSGNTLYPWLFSQRRAVAAPAEPAPVKATPPRFSATPIKRRAPLARAT